jgi:hypothetical protein
MFGILSCIPKVFFITPSPRRSYFLWSDGSLAGAIIVVRDLKLVERGEVSRMRGMFGWLKMLRNELRFVEYGHSYTKARLWRGVVTLANASYFQSRLRGCARLGLSF